MVAEGLDPIAEARKKGVTFKAAAEALIKAKEPSWRNQKHGYQWRQTLGVDDDTVKRSIVYCGNLKDMPVSEIGLEDVEAAVKPLWLAKPETATRIRNRIEAVLDFATVRGWREGDNPARWRGNLEHVLSEPKKLVRGHHPAMPFREVPAFMERLRAREAMAARALEFLILTAARTNEVLGARWSEIDLEAGLWTVPAERMKGGVAHAVPLSTAALDLLRPLHEARLSDFIFPGNAKAKRRGGSPLSSAAMQAVLERMGVENATPHGYRSTFRDWCGDTTDFPREVAEAALAHRVGSNVERSYRRGTALDKRRLLMEAWAAWCERKDAANVIPFRAG
jgi:integrase